VKPEHQDHQVHLVKREHQDPLVHRDLPALRG
jgi:hypothetical protein